MEKWWKSGDTKLVHFIGKDNIVFHCIVFPSMLKADGTYILRTMSCKRVPEPEGDKISTSKNWAVWLNEYLEEFPGKEMCSDTCCAPTLRDQGQRLHLEGLPGTQQQRARGDFRQFREPCRGADPQIFAGKVPANLKPEPIDARPCRRFLQSGNQSGKISKTTNSARLSRRL